MIWCVRVAHGVSSLKSLEELVENLLLSLLARHDVWVLAGTVDAADVVDVEHAGAVFVHNTESLKDNLLAGRVHGSTDVGKEFVVIDEAGSVVVHMGEERLQLTLREAEHVVRHSLCEFKLVKGHGVVVVHNTELLAETDDASSTTRLQLGSQSLEKVITSSLASTGGGATNFSLENLAGELTIVDSSRFVGIVQVVERVQILCIKYKS